MTHGLEYSEADDALLRALASSGCGSKRIAAKLNRSYGSVQARAARLRISIKAPARKNWEDEENRKRAQDWWREGISGKEIARRLGPPFTRSSVIARMHRDGIKRAESFITRKRNGKLAAQRRRDTLKLKNKPRPPLRPLPPKGASRFRFKDIRHHFNFKPAAPWVPEAANDTARISHEELARMHCRWPCGDPAEIGAFQPLFC